MSNMEQMEETSIIARVLNGDRQAYALLVNEYKDQIFNLAYRMTGSHEDADDLSQDTFLRAYKNLKRFDKEKRFFTWLYTISVNLIRNRLKKNIKNLSHSAAENPAMDIAEPDNTNTPEQAMIHAQRIHHLNMCLQKLPGDLREAVVLRFYQELSFENITEILGISLSAAKMRVYRGLEKLREVMGNE
jgi:RNA polymerase sigma-70 factor (ECF subfamily)